MAELDEINITFELARRAPRPPDFQAESAMMAALARDLANTPQTILQRLAHAAIEVTRANTAGIALFDEQPSAAACRWQALAGRHAQALRDMPSEAFLPCRTVLHHNAPQLFGDLGRVLPYFADATPHLSEVLFIPFSINEAPVGVIWLLTHEDGHRFDGEDVRIMSRLGEFCAAALQVVQALEARTTELHQVSRAVDEHKAARQQLEAATERDRQRSKQTLRESEARFRALVQNLPDYAIFMIDPQGFVTAWWEGAQRVKGYAPEEVIGQHLSLFYTPEDVAAGLVDRELAEAARVGRAERESWRVRKGGQRFWANEIATAIRDPAGQLIGFTKISRDLSARKRMEDALRESEERHRLIVENAREYAIFVVGAQGEILSWNTGAQRIFGYSEEQIIGRYGEILYTPEDVAEGVYQKELATAAAEGNASDDRWQLRKGGERFFASGFTTPFRGPDGALRGFVKIARDLTERQQLQEQRDHLLEQEKIARLEAERAMSIRDEFLAVVSHELRTPLTAILLWAKLLGSGGVKPADYPQIFETIRQSAEAQQQLIEDLLDISRMVSGKLRLDVRDADIAPILQAAIDAVRPMAEARNIRIDFSLDPAIGSLSVDPDRIQQIVWNLLNNAVKFTDKRGQVALLVRRLPNSVQIEVRDTGRGISSDFLPHVFERFRQADATTTRTHGGLGIGLAISRQLAELHGGTIRAESPGLGQGATFTLELPLNEMTPQTGKVSGHTDGKGGSAFAPSPVLGGLRILLVEDEAHARLAVQWLLEQCRAEVTPVPSAALAASAFREGLAHRRYDLVISDVGMPIQDGYELLRELRQLEKQYALTSRTPAIALTAYTREGDRAHAEAAGFQAHLSKPIDPATLIHTILTLTRPIIEAPAP